MKPILKAILFLLALVCTLLAQAETVKPVYTSHFILSRILEYKSLAYKPEVSIPTVKLSSEATLKEFQDDVEPQWGFRPTAITNVYVVHLNKIYLFDDKAYYTKHKRCIDDSLAHELAHYIQVQYRKWDLNDDSLEWDAIDTQNWFRSEYCKTAL